MHTLAISYLATGRQIRHSLTDRHEQHCDVHMHNAHTLGCAESCKVNFHRLKSHDAYLVLGRHCYVGPRCIINVSERKTCAGIAFDTENAVSRYLHKIPPIKHVITENKTFICNSIHFLPCHWSYSITVGTRIILISTIGGCAGRAELVLLFFGEFSPRECAGGAQTQ